MNSLRMQTEEVIAVARRFEQTAQEIETQSGQIGQRVRGIPWEGSAREEFVDHMNQLVRQLQQKAEEGVLLSQRMNREVEEWLGVDAKFADGYRATTALQSVATQANLAASGKFDNPPRNLQELADYTMHGQSPPIKIVKVGENQYLIMLHGMKLGSEGHNLGATVTNFLGLPSDYQRQVKEIIRENIPPGAEINFSGHSLGGVVADYLADDQDILKNYKIGQVYTFGSPSSGRSGDNFHRYAAEHDPAPYLARGTIFPNLASGSLHLASLDMWIRMKSWAGRQNQIEGPREHSHSSYSKSEDLRQIPIHFDQWDTDWNTAHNGQYQFGTQAESSLTAVEADLRSNDPLRILRGAVALGPELEKNFALGRADNYVRSFTDNFLPNSLRKPVDRFLDRVNERVITTDLYPGP